MNERKMLLDKRMEITLSLQDEYEVTLQNTNLNDPEMLNIYFFIRKRGHQIGYQVRLWLNNKMYVEPEVATFVSNNPESCEKYNQLLCRTISFNEVQFDYYDYDINEINPSDILGEDFDGTQEERIEFEEDYVLGFKDKIKNHISIRENYDSSLIRQLSTFGKVVEVPRFQVVYRNESIFKYIKPRTF